MQKARLLVQVIDEVTVVTIEEPSLLDAGLIQTMAEEFYDLVDRRDRRKLLLDFGRVRAMSSMAIGVLMTLRKKADAIGGKVVLCGLRTDLERVLHLTNVHKLFPVYPSQQEGMGGFG